MIRSLAAVLALLLLTATLAFADPAIRVNYELGAVVVRLEGDYAHHEYMVWRAERAEGPWTAVTSPVLCIGPCLAIDPAAEAGKAYLYRFDMVFPGGAQGSFGPYPVTVSDEVRRRVAVTVSPNPARDVTSIRLRFAAFAPSLPAHADVRLFDLQGRTVRSLHRGPVGAESAFSWDGRDDAGRVVRPGIYLLRTETPVGTLTTRVVRSR